MTHDPIIFPAGPDARRTISRRAYMAFAVGAGLLICGAIGLALTFAGSANPRTSILAGTVAIACIGFTGLLFGLMTLFGLRQPIQVEVTPHRLIWREGRKVATMEYNEVDRVDLVRDSKRVSSNYTMSFPVVRFVETDGEMIEFEVSFEDRGFIHNSRFDTLAITDTVLPYLRGHVVIAPVLDDFLQSGVLDIDSLPAR